MQQMRSCGEGVAHSCLSSKAVILLRDITRDDSEGHIPQKIRARTASCVADVAVAAQLSGKTNAISITGHKAYAPAEQGAVVWLVISQAS